MLSANEAPIPKSLPFAGCFGVARVVFVVFEVDSKLKLAPGALTTALGSRNDWVLTMVVLMANEPAIPKSPEALVLVGPETASRVLVGFNVVATIETALPSRLDVPPTDDNVSASTVWIAALTPIPDVLFWLLPFVPVALELSAVVVSEYWALAVCVKLPELDLTVPLLMRAIVSPSSEATEIAAAKFRLPSPVLALLLAKVVWPLVVVALLLSLTTPRGVENALVTNVRLLVADRFKALVDTIDELPSTRS